jgi:hypothetical protein
MRNLIGMQKWHAEFGLGETQVVHGTEFNHLDEVIISATKFIEGYRATMKNGRVVGAPVNNLFGPPDVVQWKPPSPGILKTNRDAALNSTSRKMEMEFIVRDSNGRVYVVGSFSLGTCMDPIVAKTIAALRAVEYCRNRGFLNIILEGDSLQVV